MSCETTITQSRVEMVEFESQVFHNKRNIRIYLPPGYESGDSYDVLYLNDGQHLFKSDSLGPDDYWRVDEIADSLIHLRLIEPVIIIGIDHLGNAQRAHEYLPWEDIYLFPPNPTPEGHKYPAFLTEELLPFISANYKVKPGRDHTGIGGFSYGGLISAYAALTSKDFGKVLLESPSLYVNDQQILKLASSQQHISPLKLYAGIGTNELNIANCDESNEDNLMAVEDVHSLVELIEEKSPKSMVYIEKARCGTHSFHEASKRLPKALMFLYKHWPGH